MTITSIVELLLDIGVFIGFVVYGVIVYLLWKKVNCIDDS